MNETHTTDEMGRAVIVREFQVPPALPGFRRDLAVRQVTDENGRHLYDTFVFRDTEVI